MPGSQYYYPETVRGITVALLDVFNGIQVKRRDDSGNVVKTFTLPITFGPAEKYHYLRNEDGEQKRYYLQLPRLAIALTGFSYAADRAVGVNENRFFFDEDIGLELSTQFTKDFQPTPYDLTFTLYIRTESMDDFSQVVEQILPYFNPSLHLRVKEFSTLNIERNLKVTIEGVTPDFLEVQEENQKRYVNGQINLSVNAYMYRPTTNAAIIKEIQSRYYINQFIETSASAISATETNLLTEQYNTSGHTETSAFPASSDFIVSGSLDGNYGSNVPNISSTAYYFTSASSNY
jgi:hypothetical protein